MIKYGVYMSQGQGEACVGVYDTILEASKAQYDGFKREDGSYCIDLVTV